MISTYLISVVLVACLLLWPQETIRAITLISLKIQLYYLNLRLKFAAWRVYRGLVRTAREANLPEPGPFRYVDLWDRES